jgi:predicted DNA-binding transcriptional regulator AlpA
VALKLYSIEQAPCNVPAWEVILDDLGRPPAERIARALGVSRSTVYRWHQEGTGPRIACLALFWLTRWGRSAVHTQATNDAALAAQLARSLGEERAALAAKLHQVEHQNRTLAGALAAAQLRELSPPDAVPGLDAWPSLDLAHPWPTLEVSP